MRVERDPHFTKEKGTEKTSIVFMRSFYCSKAYKGGGLKFLLHYIVLKKVISLLDLMC